MCPNTWSEANLQLPPASFLPVGFVSLEGIAGILPISQLEPSAPPQGFAGGWKKLLCTIHIFERYSSVVFSSILAWVYVGKSTACEPINCGVEQKSQRLSLGAFTICKLQFQLDWNLYLAEWFCEINNFWRRRTIYNKYIFFPSVAGTELPAFHTSAWNADSEAGGIRGPSQKKSLFFAFLALGFHPWFTVRSLLAPADGSWCEGHCVRSVLSEREWGGVFRPVCLRWWCGLDGPLFCPNWVTQNPGLLSFSPSVPPIIQQGVLNTWFRISGGVLHHPAERLPPTHPPSHGPPLLSPAMTDWQIISRLGPPIRRVRGWRQLLLYTQVLQLPCVCGWWCSEWSWQRGQWVLWEHSLGERVLKREWGAGAQLESTWWKYLGLQGCGSVPHRRSQGAASWVIIGCLITKNILKAT